MLSVLPCQSLIGSMYLDLHTYSLKSDCKKCFLFEILSALLQRRLTTKLWFSSKVLKAWNCFQGLLYDVSLFMTKTTFPLKKIPVIPPDVTYFTPQKLFSLPRHSHQWVLIRHRCQFVFGICRCVCTCLYFSAMCHQGLFCDMSLPSAVVDTSQMH